ncbi:hypothetical protein WMF38_01180 [Sorangium sp. So ce118]
MRSLQVRSMRARQGAAFQQVSGGHVKDEPGFSLAGELTLLDQMWLDTLSPLAPRR